MSNSAKSVFYFGFYLVGLGFILLLQPNFVLRLFGITVTTEVWIRVVGMLVLALSAYYIAAGKHDLIPILKITVYVRSSIILFFIAFTVAGSVQPAIILFGVVDLLGAILTFMALKKEEKW